MWIIIAIILWNIESELSDINSALRDINDSMYEEEETKEPIFVWEDENGNWLYKFE